MSCLRVGCVWTEVQSAPETQEVGCSVKLKEGTTVMIHLYIGKERTETSRPPDQETTGPADFKATRPAGTGETKLGSGSQKFLCQVPG